MLVELDEVTTVEKGTIRGSLFLRGKSSFKDSDAELSGPFSVRICDQKPNPTPAGIPEKPPSKSPAIRSAIALRGDDKQSVEEIWLFPNTVTDCAAHARPHSYSFYVLANFGAVRVGDMDARGAQPAELRFHPPVPKSIRTGGSALPQGEAAIIWDALPNTPGKQVRGHVMTADGPYGRFIAIVCP